MSEMDGTNNPKNVQVIAFGPPTAIDDIMTKLVESGNIFGYKFMLQRNYQDLANVEDYQETRKSEAKLVIIHRNVSGFSTDLITKLVNRPGSSPKVVAVWVPAEIPSFFTAVANTGAIPCSMPLMENDFVGLASNWQSHYSEAAKRRVNASDDIGEDIMDPTLVADAPPPAQYGGLTKLNLQSFAPWSSKGGDGKTATIVDLAYVLGVLGGRKTLVVDSDMNRGYLGLIMNKEARDFARTANISSLAAHVFRTGETPKLNDYVYSYPSPFAGKTEIPSNLDFIFGIYSVAGADNESLKGDAADTLIKKILTAASGAGYEFVFFDIGTLVLHAIHYAVLRNVARVLIIGASHLGSLEGTKRSLDDLLREGVVSHEKLGMVINKFTKESMISQDEIFKHLGISIRAKIPAIDLGILHRIENTNMLPIEAYLTDPKEFSAISPLVVQQLRLAEQVAVGTINQAIKTSDIIAELMGEGRGGLFKKKNSRSGKK